VALFMIVFVVISIISEASNRLEELLKLFWEDFVSLAGAL